MSTFKRISRTASTILVALAVFLAIALAGVRLVGLQPYAVLSGSMEPTYPTGSLIYVEDVAAEEVEVGDPITFVLNEDLAVATHRVIGVDEANRLFYTQGDANETPDAAPVRFENLIGMPVLALPYLGYVASYVQEPPGLYVAISACALFLMLMFLPDLFSKKERGKRVADARQRGRNTRQAGAGAHVRAARPSNTGASRESTRAVPSQRHAAATRGKGRRI